MRDEGLRIRRYEAGDREAVWRLHNEALDEVGAHLGNGAWDDDLHEIEAAYLKTGGEFLVGVLDGGVVAMGALRRVSPEEAEIKRMRVEPTLQGRGHGQALLDALHRRAEQLGYSTLRLDTAVRQRAARGLYERNGYREVRRGRIGPFDCVFYERRTVA
ncbi:MAG: GNAT family N-acetyltransferase [Actinomycetota bacterium]|nr:GNAT family N-acetyltransferase [Actinomycetota bacterium]